MKTLMIISALFVLAISLPGMAKDRYRVVIHQADKTATVKKPIVRGYTQRYCSACVTAKNALDKAKVDLPFDVEWVDTNGNQPEYITVTPSFDWEVNGKRWYWTGWPGTKTLTDSWKLTGKVQDAAN